MPTQNYTVEHGGTMDVCFTLHFTPEDAKSLSDVGLTQKRYITAYIEDKVNVDSLATEAKSQLMKSISDPKQRDALMAEIQRSKAEQAVKDAVSKLKALDLDPEQIAALLAQ